MQNKQKLTSKTAGCTPTAKTVPGRHLYGTYTCQATPRIEVHHTAAVMNAARKIRKPIDNLQESAGGMALELVEIGASRSLRPRAMNRMKTAPSSSPPINRSSPGTNSSGTTETVYSVPTRAETTSLCLAKPMARFYPAGTRAGKGLDLPAAWAHVTVGQSELLSNHPLGFPSTSIPISITSKSVSPSRI